MAWFENDGEVGLASLKQDQGSPRENADPFEELGATYGSTGARAVFDHLREDGDRNTIETLAAKSGER